MSGPSETQSHGQVGPSASARHRTMDDWEQWEDDDVVTPIDPDEQVLIEAPVPPTRSTKSIQSRASRQPSTRIKRLKSRHRQKAQNAKAGIKLITDMTTFRRQNHIANQLRTPDGRPVKFVDAAALRALEGEPSSASVGNWNWLKRDKGKSPLSATPQTATVRSPGAELTPGDAPIMIGMQFPSEVDSRGNEQSSSQATQAQNQTGGSTTQHAPEHQTSVWSPDTPSTASTATNFRAPSSIYSQATNLSGSKQPAEDVPPVPALPSNYKKSPHQRLISLEIGGNGADSDDGGTPCTLFEEDGSPSVPKHLQTKGFSPDSASSQSKGWWDHVVTPFLDKRFTYNSRKTRLESPRSPLGVTQETHSVSPAESYTDEKVSAGLLPVPHASPPPIVRAPTPRRTPTPPSNDGVAMANPTAAQPRGGEDRDNFSEKPQIIVTPELPLGTPPPYSPPRQPGSLGRDAPIRYRAVFPPGHPLLAQYPPMPGPGSPGLAATMTSQGATQMSDIPITPTVPRDMPTPPTMPLPNRPVGTCVPQEHSHSARGSGYSVERERRRHEKEEAITRKLGGFWRGRGCIPSNGCFGRSGREGRKRRRWCICGLAVLIALIILAIVLGVTLTRPGGSSEVETIWLNLTDYPPMPTGVLTVVGSDNTVAKSGCSEPSTAWSCSLPRADQESVEPYKPNQPTFIMQIQWDNSTKESWNVPNGEKPKSISRRAPGGAVHAASVVRDGQSTEFKPKPTPPDYQEMWFLGDTTDGIKDNDKAGEPAPFYISLLDSMDRPVDDPVLTKRQTTIGDDIVKNLVSDPELEDDGTPVEAVMLPTPVQQPVRLYDRGLPTEHYGFYTYFKRTIYLKSVNETEEDVPLDEDGGCTKTEANYLVTWSQTRMLVRIWTKKLDDDASLLPEGDSIAGSAELIRPGTMPYPVTVTLDTHGGNREEKYVWYWPMDERQKLDTDNPKLLPNDMEFGGTIINHRKDEDESFGGFDGGSGGCKCEWVNWT